MTIKQQGGIFGRNPEFNDVSVKQDLLVTDNVFVGTTSASSPASSSSGIELKTDVLVVGRSDNTAAIFGRNGSSGDIVLLRDDGSTVGSLGCDGGQSYIGNDSVGLRFDDVSPARIVPFAPDSGETTGTIDLGRSVARFNRIYLTGDINTSGGNLVVASGKGIDFSATSGTGTSELFDDYEEGTWTPVIIGRSSAGTGTYTTQRGMYTKVGDTVFFYAILNWSAHTGTGNMAISGLPFTTFSTIGHNPTMAVMGDNLTFSGQLAAIIDRNATTITIRTFASGGAATDLAIDTAGGIYVSGFYKAA